ncbi:MAG: hypothetical protein GY813_09545 [Halieaceae bacterium]|nr:hypothetical protein [Halieaceae bacterium]
MMTTEQGSEENIMETRRHGAIHRHNRLWQLFSISAFQHFSMGTSTTRTTSSMRRIGNLRGIRFTYVSQHQQKGRPWAQAGSIKRTL